MIKKNDLKNLAKSFSYAFKGIAFSIKNERNMRIHLCMTILVSLFAYFYKVSQTEFVMLILCFAFVITSEMINTAIETLTNLQSPSYNFLAKVAKDVAAGAVLISAIASIIVGFIVFFKPHRLALTIMYIITNPLYCVLFIVLILLSILFIFNGTKFFNEPETKIYRIKNYNSKKLK